MNMSGLLDKKIGPVPVLYIAAGLVAILGVVAWRMKSAPDAPVETVPEEDAGIDGDPYSGLATNGTVVAAPASTIAEPDTIDSNEEWARAAAAYLLDKKLASPGDALTSMTKYINGAQLSYEEGGLRDAAISGIGYPPDPLQGTSIVLDPVARKQFDGFPGVHSVTSPADNTFAKIAALYYGKSDPLTVSRLQQNNPTLGNTTFPVGTKVQVGALKVDTTPPWNQPKPGSDPRRAIVKRPTVERGETPRILHPVRRPDGR